VGSSSVFDDLLAAAALPRCFFVCTAATASAGCPFVVLLRSRERTALGEEARDKSSSLQVLLLSLVAASCFLFESTRLQAASLV
jgi:hypothetical protein